MQEIIEQIGDWRRKQGFETGWGNMPEKLMLVVTEVSEAMEAYRNYDRINFAEEVADTIIRLFDICDAMGIDIEAEIKQKMAVNLERPYKHDKKC